MRFQSWLASLSVLAAFGLAAQANSAPQRRAETLAFVVQVAVHYGPQRDALLSGVVAADGRTILTDPGSLEGAQEISVAFTDLEVLDADARPGSPTVAIGIVDLRQAHGPKATFVPADTAVGELEALAGGAPESFRLATTPVRLRPMRGTGAQMRWDITPVLPTYYRGGALLDAQGRVLGLIVRERDSGIMVGVPLRVFADLAGVNLARAGAAAQPALVPRIPEAPLPLRGRPAGVESQPAPSETRARAGSQPPAPRKVEPPTPVVRYLELPLAPPATGWVWRSAAPPPPQVARASSEPPPIAGKPASPETAAPSAGGGSTPPERQAVPEPGEDVLRRIRWANEQNQYGNRAGAVASLEDALKTYPDQPVLYYHLGFAYWSLAFYDSQGHPRKTMERGAYRKAVRAFESFLSRASPDDPKVSDAKAKLELLRGARFGYKPK